MAEKKGLRKGLWILGIIVLSIIILLTVFFIIRNHTKESFSVKPILLKLSLSKSGQAENSIKIVNNGAEARFDVYFENLNDIAFLKENSFFLGAGESKSLDINFKDSKNQVSIYLGELIIETPELKKTIPVMVTIENKESNFAVIQKAVPRYESAYPGGKFGIEIKIVALKEKVSPNVKARYSIQNFEGEMVWMDEGNLIVGESWTEIAEIPEDLNYGDYVFVTFIEHEGAESVEGYLFSISEEKKGVLDFTSKIYLIIILVFISIILVLLFHFIKTRDELFMQLRKQQDQELKRNLGLISIYKKNLSEARQRGEAEHKIKQINEARKRVVTVIKEKQREQMREVKQLKKKGKKNTIKDRLKKWKREGYKMFEAEKEMKKISKADMSRMINNWKKRGYKTDFLNRKL
jgi:hypothetical protein